MFLHRIISLLTVITVLWLGPSPGFADENIVDLIDRQPDVAQVQFLNQYPPDFPDQDGFIAQQVTFATSVTIDSISTYFNDQADWSVVPDPMAYLNIFSDPLLQSDDPLGGTLVPITISPEVNGVQTITTSGALDIMLPAGNYWIALTPIVNFTMYGQAQHYQTASKDGTAQFRNPGGFFGFSDDWQDVGEMSSNGFPEFNNFAITISGKVDAMETVFPDSFLIIFGSNPSGDLSDLLVSDDQYLRVFNSPAVSPLFASVEVEFTGTVVNETPAELTFTLEAACNGIPTEQRVQLRNYDTGNWDFVDVRAAPTSDTEITVTIATDAARYVQDGTGEVKARIGYRDLGANQAGWSGRYDLIFWTTN